MNEKRIGYISILIGIIIHLLLLFPFFIPFQTLIVTKVSLKMTSQDSFELITLIDTFFLWNLDDINLLMISISFFLLSGPALLLSRKYPKLSSILWFFFSINLFIHWYITGVGARIASLAVAFMDFGLRKVFLDHQYSISSPLTPVILLICLLSLINAILELFIAFNTEISISETISLGNAFTTGTIIFGLFLVIFLPISYQIPFSNSGLITALKQVIIPLLPRNYLLREIFYLALIRLFSILLFAFWIGLVVLILPITDLLKAFKKKREQNKGFVEISIVFTLILLLSITISQRVIVTPLNEWGIVLLEYFGVFGVFSLMLFVYIFKFELINNKLFTLRIRLQIEQLTSRLKLVKGISIIFLFFITIFPVNPLYLFATEKSLIPNINNDRISVTVEVSEQMFDNGTIILTIHPKIEQKLYLCDPWELESYFFEVITCFFDTSLDGSYSDEITIQSIIGSGVGLEIKLENKTYFINQESKIKEIPTWEVRFNNSARLEIQVEPELLIANDNISLVFCTYSDDYKEFNDYFDLYEVVVISEGIVESS